MAFNINSFRCHIDITFRVEFCNTKGWQNSTFRDQSGNMSPRDATRHPDTAACRDHLDIQSRRPGPFISMFTNWNAALAKREDFIKKGATNVVIVAVWSKGLTRIHDAYNIAGALGIGERDLYLHEVLLWGGISADEYRILAVFDGMGQPIFAMLSLPGCQMEVRLPLAFIRRVQEETGIATHHHPDGTNGLQSEVYMLSGTTDNKRFFRLALCIGGLGYTSESYDTEEIIIIRIA